MRLPGDNAIQLDQFVRAKLEKPVKQELHIPEMFTEVIQTDYVGARDIHTSPDGSTTEAQRLFVRERKTYVEKPSYAEARHVIHGRLVAHLSRRRVQDVPRDFHVGEMYLYQVFLPYWTKDVVHKNYTHGIRNADRYAHGIFMFNKHANALMVTQATWSNIVFNKWSKEPDFQSMFSDVSGVHTGRQEDNGVELPHEKPKEKHKSHTSMRSVMTHAVEFGVFSDYHFEKWFHKGLEVYEQGRRCLLVFNIAVRKHFFENISFPEYAQVIPRDVIVEKLASYKEMSLFLERAGQKDSYLAYAVRGGSRSRRVSEYVKYHLLIGCDLVDANVQWAPGVLAPPCMDTTMIAHRHTMVRRFPDLVIPESLLDPMLDKGNEEMSILKQCLQGVQWHCAPMVLGVLPKHNPNYFEEFKRKHVNLSWLNVKTGEIRHSSEFTSSTVEVFYRLQLCEHMYYNGDLLEHDGFMRWLHERDAHLANLELDFPDVFNEWKQCAIMPNNVQLGI